MDSFLKDVRHAARSFLRSPGFTFIAVLTLALGIGANTAIFSVVDGVLLEPLPYPDADELMVVGHTAPGLDLPELPSATGMHLVYGEHNRTLQETSLYGRRQHNLTGDGGPPERITTAVATPSLFRVLRTGAALGRTFTDEEGRPGGGEVTLLSHRLWQERFGADPDMVGRTIQVNGVSRQVVGIMPRGFTFPGDDTRLWFPLEIDPAQPHFGGFNFTGLARRRPEATPGAIRRDLESLLPRVTERFELLTPEMIRNTGLGVTVTPLAERVVGDVRTALWVILGTVGFVLLIACANVANLILVRAEGRRKEVAIRAAMGADRVHLLRQFMAESGLLAVTGALLGLLLAHQGLGLLLAVGPEQLPRMDQIDIDGTVLAYTGSMAILAALVFGIIPVLRHRATGAAAILRDGTRGSTSGRGGHRARKLLVVSQVAFALMLLVGSGLMVRSFQRLQDVDPGFRAEDVLTFRISLPGADYPDMERTAEFHHRLLDRLQALPGVEVAGAVSHLPLSGPQSMDPLIVEGHPVDPDRVPPIIEMRAATPGYFGALGIPVVEGRMTERADALDRSGAILASERVARLFFQGEETLGRQVAHGLPQDHEPWSRIVGVVADVRNAALTEDPMGAVYYPLLQRDGVTKDWLTRSMSYALKTDLPPMSLVPAVRRIVREMDPDLPLAEVGPLSDALEQARAQMGFTMLLLGIAAGVGLLLGAVGLYGVVSWVTTQRTREIGVRMALGAEAGAVRGMVMRQGMAVTGTGVALGLLGAWGLSRFMASVLYGVGATDPLTFGSVTGLLLLVALAATWLPARRAARVNVVEALRRE